MDIIQRAVDTIEADIRPKYIVIVDAYHELPPTKDNHHAKLQYWDIDQLIRGDHSIQNSQEPPQSRLLMSAASIQSFIQYADEWLEEYNTRGQKPTQRIELLQTSRDMLQTTYGILYDAAQNDQFYQK